jgi:hypothetical protein
VCAPVVARVRTDLIRSVFLVLRDCVCWASAISLATRTMVAPGTPCATRTSRMSSMGGRLLPDEAAKVNLFTQERNGILSQSVEAVDRLGGIIF